MAHSTIDDRRIGHFETEQHGDLVSLTDPILDDAHTVWSGMMDERLALVARLCGVTAVRSAHNGDPFEEMCDE